jgi:hypothetical protein
MDVVEPKGLTLIRAGFTTSTANLAAGCHCVCSYGSADCKTGDGKAGTCGCGCSEHNETANETKALNADADDASIATADPVGDIVDPVGYTINPVGTISL